MQKRNRTCCIIEIGDKMKDFFAEEPEDLNRIGKDVFIKIPFYRKKGKATVLYINLDKSIIIYTISSKIIIH